MIGRALAAFGLALVLTATGVAGFPAATAVSSTRTSTSMLDLAAGLSRFMPLDGVFAALGQPAAIDDGPDNRLTVLLLGSDARTGAVSRTDTIMVISVKNNVITAASIPRDTARIPNPFTASTTDTFTGRVNGIFQTLKKNDTIEHALVEFEQVIEHLLQIEIDYHALITFEGFHAMVDVVDPITLNITKAIKDSKYWDDPTRIKGVYFPIRNNYQLWAWQPGATPPLCNGLWRNDPPPIASVHECARAMPFVRSRKGNGNSDFVRASRQQLFVYETIQEINATNLASLLAQAQGQNSLGDLYTNIPMNLADLQVILNRIGGATLGNRVVFKPKVYSTHIPGGTAYQLKLSVVRAWADTNLQ